MQVLFLNDQQGVNDFRKALSEPRFLPYLRQSNGEVLAAVCLYDWNCKLAQSLYFPLHMWEIVFRNKMNRLLVWKFQNPDWPYDAKLWRQLTGPDQRRLREARDRQESKRGRRPAPTDAIVADLSAGFWVSLLTNAYTLPLQWRHNIGRVFPNNTNLTQGFTWEMCDDLLTVRNRIAHHEPIYKMPLGDRRTTAGNLLSAMCTTSSAYTTASCTFWPVWNAGPPQVPVANGPAQ